MIDIDTERLRSLMEALSVANDQIEEAATLLLQITTHDNWACRERHLINEYTMENRKKIQQIRDDSQRFLSAATAVAEEFTDTESSIQEMFSSLEGLLGRILSNPLVGGIVTNGANSLGGPIGGSAAQIADGMNRAGTTSDCWENIEWSGSDLADVLGPISTFDWDHVWQPIPIVDFTNIDW